MKHARRIQQLNGHVAPHDTEAPVAVDVHVDHEKIALVDPKVTNGIFYLKYMSSCDVETCLCLVGCYNGSVLRHWSGKEVCPSALGGFVVCFCFHTLFTVLFYDTYYRPVGIPADMLKLFLEHRDM